MHARDRASILPWCSMWSCIGVVVALACVVVGAMGVGAQAAEACPNDALRQELRSGQLPDCRAYEMVSPVYKAGSHFTVSTAGNGQSAISEDGSHVMSFALGAFAETKSEPFENTVYELSRTASGWMPSALDPPGSLSPESTFLGASKDLTRTLWALHSPSGSINEEDLYVREMDGSFVEIGPMVPPSFASGPPAGTTTTKSRNSLINTQYLKGGGASADLSHVLVSVVGFDEVLGDRWPGDSTLAGKTLDSLYEYVGTGLARPELVGVDNEGKQITQCGTDLGTGASESQGNRYNAISENGEKVFFTANAGGCVGEDINHTTVVGQGPAVNDLFARIDGTETINISEPLRFQCALCQTSRSEVTTTEQPAVFQGASEDGSKVFFTTEQELLPGQTTTNLYEYDFDSQSGLKVVLASPGSPAPEVQSVASVSEDGSHAYFIAAGALTGANSEGNAPSTAPGAHNLYVFERDAAHAAGEVSFIATLPSSSLLQSQATPDGRFLVFTSSGDLTADDTSTVEQVFEYDAQAERLVRISVGQCPSAAVTCAPGERFNNDGNTGSYPAGIVTPSFRGSDGPAEAESHLSVSNDGSRVFFDSADDLTEAAVVATETGALSVYEYRSTGLIADGNVYLISDGKDVQSTDLFGTDASGGDVFFETGDVLLAEDTNAGKDLYDARVAGGFAEPTVPVGCVGEACQGARSGSSLFVSPASASTAGGGNLTPAAEAKPPAPVKPRPVSKVSTRAQKLASALKACHKDTNRHKRTDCEARARKRYGSRSKMASTSRGARR
ncbi:MAG: hypothetical protein WB709_03905 [Solirubrobacteraceae bacterium]